MVTIEERLDAWKASGGDSQEIENMRYRAVMYQRLPLGVVPYLVIMGNVTSYS
jgi:hypothetical protein